MAFLTPLVMGFDAASVESMFCDPTTFAIIKKIKNKIK